MSAICFQKVSKEDMGLIEKILERFEAKHTDATRMENLLDLMNCQEGVCPLDLGALLGANDYEFFHDMFGIKAHFDRQKKVLTGGFLPRFAKLDDQEAISAYS